MTSHRGQSHLDTSWNPLRSVKLVSLTEVPVGTTLRRLKLVGFIYVTVKPHKDV